MMVYSISAIEHPQDCTNHDEHDKHGSGEPVNRALQHYITSYIQCLWWDITGPRNNTQFSLLFFLSKIICRNNLPNPSATPTRGFYLPELGAIPACGIDLPERTPLPRSESPSKTQPATLPPSPHQLCVTEEGEGGGRLTRLAYASWTGTFPSISFYMFDMIYILTRIGRCNII
jgi:hypothetical protein